MKNKRALAIVGLGPRGLSALENFLLQLRKEGELGHLKLLLFEMTGDFGNGQVYGIHQSVTNWINISERILCLDKRPTIDFKAYQIPSFPSYHEWVKKDFSKIDKSEADTYPPRAEVGEYLKERFETLIQPLLKASVASLIEEQVESVSLDDDKVSIKTSKREYTGIDELLLTIGHQPTELSEQMLKWEQFSSDKKSTTLFKSPYPIKNFLESPHLTPDSVVGLRGFGLAMIDVARGIANKFGTFVTENETDKKVRYQSDHTISNMLIPFSLDGLPPSPKPINALIDEWYQPTEKQITNFENIIQDKQIQRKADDPGFLIKAFAPIAAEIYLTLSEYYDVSGLSVQKVEAVVIAWMEDMKYSHPIILRQDQPAEKMMQDFIEMALGKKAISLDFCVGQVWRHLQPSIYDKLSYNECENIVCKKIIQLDEGLKRYSYGPPVESIQQMLALIKAGVMNVQFVNDPAINLTDDGWLLESDKKNVVVDMMINSVLDSPKIKLVDSPIVKSLLSADLAKAVHSELGVVTDERGYLISSDENNSVPIALLGRLAKGTVIGVDAILECFGKRSEQWAERSARHFINCIENEE